MNEKRRQSRERARSIKRWPWVELKEGDYVKENHQILENVVEVSEEFNGFAQGEEEIEGNRYKKIILDKER